MSGVEVVWIVPFYLALLIAVWITVTLANRRVNRVIRRGRRAT